MIRLDSRERVLAAHLPEAERVCLAAGDVDIEGRVVLERKRVDDLAASIRDGRWRDQLARLRNAPRAALVIEGELPRDDQTVNGVTGISMRSALAGAFVRDGIANFRTGSVGETAQLVRSLAIRVRRLEPPSEQTTCGARLPKRSEALADTRVVALAQLCVVPGTSRAVADRVLGTCRTMGEWMARWSGGETELAELQVGRKRLGPVLAERLLRLCGASSVTAAHYPVVAPDGNEAPELGHPSEGRGAVRDGLEAQVQGEEG
jgi:ERCC4-type nuclease